MRTVQLSLSKVGRKIRNLRINGGLSMSSFAFILNVDPKTIANWENGVNLPNLFNLINLCNIFKISIDEFVLFED